jgi:hypothetical protein
MEHIQEHEQMMQMAMQEQAMQAAMSGMPPQEDGSAQDPTQTKAQGKGAPASVKEQMVNVDTPPGDEPR